MSALPCLTNIRPNAPIFQVTAGGGNIPLNQDIVCSTINVGETATIAALNVSSINGQQPGGGGGSYPSEASFSSISVADGGFINMPQGNINLSTINGYEYTPGGGGGSYPSNIVASTLTVSSIAGSSGLAVSAGPLFVNDAIYIQAPGNELVFPNSDGNISGVSSINGEPYVPGGGGGGVPPNLTVSTVTTTDVIGGGANSTINVQGNYCYMNPPLYFASHGQLNFQDSAGELIGVSTINGVPYTPAGAYPLVITASTMTVSSIVGGDNGSLSIGGQELYINPFVMFPTAGYITFGDNAGEILGISTINGAPYVPGGGGGGGPNITVSTIGVADTLTLYPPTGISGSCPVSMDNLQDVSFGGSVRNVNISSIVCSTINGVAPGGAPQVVYANYLGGGIVPPLDQSELVVLSTIHTPATNGTYLMNASIGVSAVPSSIATWYLYNLGYTQTGQVLETQNFTDTRLPGGESEYATTIPVTASLPATGGTQYILHCSVKQQNAVAGEIFQNLGWNVVFYPSA